MRNLYTRGENILIRWNTVDKLNEPILFSAFNDILIDVTDSQGNSQGFTKLGGTVIQGVETNQLQFEITEAMTTAFVPGRLVARFTYKLPSADHASLEMVDIIQENDFITLAE